MAEEQRWQELGGSHRPCANNCGFFGSPTTLHLCSKCYKDRCMKEQQVKDAHAALEITTIPQSESSIPPPPKSSEPPTVEPALLQIESAPPVGPEAPQVSADSNNSAAAATTIPNRCGACRKRVGLTGFACRCGVTFCGLHRYPEKHGCGFDYKAMGREAIAKANPVIKGEKLNKI